MKTLLCEIPEDVKPGDLVILSYRSQRGGRTHAMHRMRDRRPEIVTKDGKEDVVWHDADTRADAVAAMIAQTQSSMGGWMREAFETKAKGNAVMVQCTGLVADCEFEIEVESADGTKVYPIEAL